MMKSCAFIAVVLLIAAIIIIPRCCASNKTIDGKTYSTYGLFNQDQYKNDSIQYEVSTGSVVVGVIFCETLIVPVYLVGWDLWQPIGKKTINPADKGIIQ